MCDTKDCQIWSGALEIDVLVVKLVPGFLDKSRLGRDRELTLMWISSDSELSQRSL